MISSSSTSVEKVKQRVNMQSVTCQSPHYKRSEIKYSDAQVNSSLIIEHQHTDRSVDVL